MGFQIALGRAGETPSGVTVKNYGHLTHSMYTHLMVKYLYKVQILQVLAPPGLKNKASLKMGNLRFLEWPLEAVSKSKSVPLMLFSVYIYMAYIYLYGKLNMAY